MKTLVAPKKLRGPIKRHGGKCYLARRIIGLFPTHDVYCEPFIGGGTVLLNKVPATEECAADLDSGLVRMWRVLAEYPCSLIDDLGRTPYDAERFKAACYSVAHDFGQSDIDFAAAFIVKNRFSRGGMGKDFAWSDRLRGGQPGDANAWQTILGEMPLIAGRLKGVNFYNRDALSVIGDWDGPGVLHYLDPPYCPETRTARKVYDHEVSRERHGDLLDLIRSCKGSVAISGYRCGLYDDALWGWRRAEFDMPNHSSQSKVKQRRIECLWMNY